MPTKIIVSYDGTANEDDAITLGRLLGQAGASPSLAYVRHSHELSSDRETLADALGGTVAPVANGETDLLVFDSRGGAEPGRISLSASASHLIEIATCPVLVLPRGVRLRFGQTPVAA